MDGATYLRHPLFVSENHRQSRWFKKALAMHEKNILLW